METWIVFLPTWQAGQTLPGVDQILAGSEGQEAARLVDRTVGGRLGPPNPRVPVFGELFRNWAPYWYIHYRTNLMSATAGVSGDDWGERIRRSHAMLSVFGLLPPMTNDGTTPDATQLLRRGAREYDITPALLAGNMVIVAEAEDDPLPVSLRVEGERVQGQGRTIYQFILPLDMSAVDAVLADPADPAGDAADLPGSSTAPAALPENVPGQPASGGADEPS